jgi:GNAT superfamily N-acetyltransferase
VEGRLLQKWVSRARERGTLAVAGEVLRDAVALDRFRWFFGALPELPESLSPGCWRLLTPVERDAWVGAQLQARPDQRHMYEVALENDHLLFAAFLEGALVGRRWVGRGWTYVDRPDCVMVRLAPETAYAYDLFIEKAHRRKGIAYDGFLFRMRTLREMGFRRFATGVIGGNRVGSKHVMELGFPWWDSTRITVAGRPLWLKGKPWHRIGDRVLQERR